ncbi:MAG: response regulator [Deltaproteobacteria bacterium]|nr:response regulator [Deltaproteobacteria bacterium]
MVLLVVDDEAVQLESLRRGLRSKGYDFVGAKSGQEALDVLKSVAGEGVGMVITDYAMPDMNGIELLNRVRSVRKTLPFILMTAYGDKQIVINALRSGCQGYIEKPFTLEQLLDEIQRTVVISGQEETHQELCERVQKLVHQINNPLVCIIGSAELASCHIDDSEVIKKNIHRILESTDRISKINEEILKLGRKDIDKSTLVDINGLLEECLSMFNGLMILKGIELKKELTLGEVNLFADKFGLQQLFNNILLNAIDAMEGKVGKTLRVTTSIDKNRSFISACIEDTGCGIPENAIETIFSPYVTTKDKGTGLGLAVAKNVVEKHDGRIDVESQPGKGTLFRITLPTGGRANM